MDKAKQYVIWLDGFIDACGSSLNEEQLKKAKKKLDGIFDHEAMDAITKPTLSELGEQHNFEVTNNNNGSLGRTDPDGTVYRC